MSIRLSYAFAVVIFLIAAVIRFASLSDLPLGLTGSEIDDIRIAETIRQGRVEAFYNLNGEGREGLYQTVMTGLTAIAGGGSFGFRILSLFVGMIGLALVYALGTRLCGPLGGMTAMGLLAVNFSTILLARSITREAVLMAWSAAVMLCLARAFFVYGSRTAARPDTAAFAALGVLLGLGFYIHPVALVVTLFAMAFIVYRVFTERPFPRRALSFTWFTLVVVIVLAMPYVLSSIQLPNLAGTTRLVEEFPTTPSELISRVAAGFNGFLFVGDTNPAHNLPGRPLFDLVSGVLMAVGLLVAISRARESGNALLILALIFITPAALLAPVAPNFQTFAVLMPVLALLFGMGVSTVFWSLRGVARQVVVVALIALFGFNLWWAVDDLFNDWATLPETAQVYDSRIGALARFLDQNRVETPVVLCARQLSSPNPYELTSIMKLALMMHRADAPLRAADCGESLILTNGGETQYVVMVEADGLSAVNPQLQPWLAQGEIVNRPDVPANSVITLRAADALADRVGSFTTISPVTFAPDEPGGFGVALPPIRFEGNLTFLGYDVGWADQMRPGDVLTVVTYWRIDGIVPRDLRFFTHVQNDPAARPVAQHDTIGLLPYLLEPRDVLVQVNYINLPFSLRDGGYTISVGAYEAATGNRLASFAGDVERSSRLFIGDFRIQR